MGLERGQSVHLFFSPDLKRKMSYAGKRQEYTFFASNLILVSREKANVRFALTLFQPLFQQLCAAL